MIHEPDCESECTDGAPCNCGAVTPRIGQPDPALAEINRLQAQRDQFAAAIDRMKPVYDAAVAWRDTWRHRHPFGEEAKAIALVDAVDGALAKATTSVACPGCECWTPESHASFCPARAS